MSTLSHSSAAARRSGRTVTRLLDLISLRRSRQSLLALDEHMLRDIGVTAEQAQAEANRSVWDAHPWWKR